jgi:hypothetical protein
MRSVHLLPVLVATGLTLHSTPAGGEDDELIESVSEPETPVDTDPDGIPILPDDTPLACPTEVDDGRYHSAWSTTGKHQERGSCKNGLAVRTWNAWYDNGVKAWRGFLEAGFFAGQVESWYDNGQRRARVHYEDGLLHGDVTLWWPDGTLRGLGSYEQGLAQGCHSRWHEDGTRASIGAYLDDHRVGRWLHWDELGQRHKEHLGGRPAKGRCWWPLF